MKWPQNDILEDEYKLSCSPPPPNFVTPTHTLSKRLVEQQIMNQDVVDQIRAVLYQESTIYQNEFCDYLSKAPSRHPSVVDDACRRKMSQWCVSFCDYCELDQDTAAMAVRNLDRYLSLSSCSILECRKAFQVASMTLLYTTVKVVESDLVSPDSLANLSRGVCTASDIVDLEAKILKEVNWHIYPPTALAFVRLMIEAFGDALPKEVKDSALQQAFDSIHEYELVPFPSSIVAMAAMGNSLDENSTNLDSLQIWTSLLQTMEGVSCEDFIHVRQVLWKVRLSKITCADDTATEPSAKAVCLSPSSSMVDLSNKPTLSFCLTIGSQDDLSSGYDTLSSCESVVFPETSETSETHIHIICSENMTECVLEQIPQHHSVQSPTCVMAESSHSEMKN
eukprot:CAMPEP_0198282520 /NCGR_PEP_ID=MMETSP1449-20131203/2312_1 /TAXON_ID=420275 /ORGANISM="Attheya septentrionalis, Strain CCMP2084" /LENGTH=393 /DNA_ID=CAMNT_0043978795 /DNA_START=205 /DNA_END=1386 /DNA_ORIENTATION=-